MPRTIPTQDSCKPYLVHAWSNCYEPFHCGLAASWRIFQNQCFEATLLHGATIHGLVVLPEQIYLLLSTPEEPIGKVMHHFQRSAAKSLNRLSGRTGRAFGAQYRACLMSEPEEYAMAARHVFRSPVRRELCARAEDYPFTTLRTTLGKDEPGLRLGPAFPAFGEDPLCRDITKITDWINAPLPESYEDAIRLALRRARFQIPRGPWRSQITQEMLPLVAKR